MTGVTKEEIEKLREGLEKHAEKKGYRLNPDTKVVEKLLEKLLLNQKKYGHMYCPCRVLTGNFGMDLKMVCPCDYHEEEIEVNGVCQCNLFWKKEVDEK